METSCESNTLKYFLISSSSSSLSLKYPLKLFSFLLYLIAKLLSLIFLKILSNIGFIPGNFKPRIISTLFAPGFAVTLVNPSLYIKLFKYIVAFFSAIVLSSFSHFHIPSSISFVNKQEKNWSFSALKKNKDNSF